MHSLKSRAISMKLPAVRDAKLAGLSLSLHVL